MPARASRLYLQCESGLMALSLRFVGVSKRFQYCIHARLVAGSLLPEPGEHIFVHTQCDLRFSRWKRQSAMSYRIRPICG